MSITAAVSGTIVKAFNVTTLSLSAVENLASAGEKMTRSLDVAASIHLSSVIANQDEANSLSKQRQILLNARLQAELQREADQLGIALT